MKGLAGANKATVISFAVAIGALVAVNAAARLIVRLAGPDGIAEFYIGLWSLGAMAVVIGVAGFVWTRRYLIARVVGDALVVTIVSSLLVALLGPLVSGSSPFSGQPFGDGFRATFVLFLTCEVVLGIGVIIGSLLAMAFGLDPKSRAWKAQAETVRAAARRRQRKATAKSLR